MRFPGAGWLLNKLYPEKCDVDIAAEPQKFYRLFCERRGGKMFTRRDIEYNEKRKRN
nr:hypothetical protein [uncultured Desulfobacter sp.]